jgi:hypothetical protein
MVCLSPAQQGLKLTMSSDPTRGFRERFAALFAQGRRQGYLTYAEVNAHLPKQIEPPLLDQILLYLQDQKIELVDEASREDKNERTEMARANSFDELRWTSATDPQAMLRFLQDSGHISPRKLRLCGAAVCRRIWPFLIDLRSQTAMGFTERFADGEIDQEKLRHAGEEAYRAWEASASFQDDRGEPPDKDLYGSSTLWRKRPYQEDPIARHYLAPHRNYAIFQAAYAAFMLTAGVIDRVLSDGQEAVWFATEGGQQEAVAEEVRSQSDILRDLVGPLPFRPITIDRAWLTWNNGTVAKLAATVYNERLLPSGHLDASRLGVLADTLEEAGCRDAEILGHLRSVGPHYRGCHIIDRLLSRE